MKLILVRHGETETNRLGRIQGVNQTPLNERGLEQAAAAADAICPDAPFTLYSSPLRRAAQTAEAIVERVGIRAIEEDGLIEMDVGEFEGLTGQQLRERFPDVMRAWDENAFQTVMPGGESLETVRDRAWQTVKNLADHHGGETVVAVTHNFTIQTILCTVLGMPPNNFRSLRIDLGSITRLDVGTGRTVQLSVNETWHLRGLREARSKREE